MRRHNSAFLVWRVLTSGLLLVFSGLFASAYCQAAEIAVLIEQSPPGGGEVAGGTGIHYFPSGSMIRLTAVPRPGYHFLYWLGDVIDPHSISTAAYLDGPKIIVAVYARISEDEIFELGDAEEEIFEFEEMSPSAGGAPRSMGGGGGGVRAKEPTPPASSFRAVGHPRKPSVEVIAEPSTVFLFGLAAVMLRRKQRRF